MIDESFIYWLTRLDRINNFLDGFSLFLTVIVGVSICFFIGSTLVQLLSNYEDEIKHAKNLKSYAVKVLLPSFIFLILMNIGSMFIPSTKEMAAIYVIPKVANNERLNDIGNQMMNLATEWLKELHPKTENINTQKEQ